MRDLSTCAFFIAINCGPHGSGYAVDQVQIHALHYPEKADYHCQYGYHDNTTREVAVSLQCQSNGTWSRAPPICIRTCQFNYIISMLNMICLYDFISIIRLHLV